MNQNKGPKPSSPLLRFAALSALVASSAAGQSADSTSPGLPLDPLRQRLAPAGFTFELGVTTVWQIASDSADSDRNNLATVSYDFAGRWILVDDEHWGVGGPGYRIEGGRPLLASQFEDLTTDIGSGFGLNDDLLDNPAIVSELWWEQSFLDGAIVATLGKIDQTNYFDANRAANDEATQFLASPLVNNPAVAFPDPGLGANLTVTPNDALVLALGLGDASAQADETGFNTVDQGNWFAAGEIGLTPHFDHLGDGAYRLLLWTTNTEDGESGQGIAVSCDQEVGDAGGFVRPIRHRRRRGGRVRAVRLRRRRLVRAGTNALGFAAAWGRPSDPTSREQTQLEVFHRVEICPCLVITPDLQLLLHPTDNPARDAIAAWGRPSDPTSREQTQLELFHRVEICPCLVVTPDLPASDG